MLSLIQFHKNLSLNNSKPKYFATEKKSFPQKFYSKIEQELSYVPEGYRALYERLPRNVRPQFLINLGIKLPSLKTAEVRQLPYQKKQKKAFPLNQQKFRNESALNRDLNLKLTKVDYSTKFYKKNIDKINRYTEHLKRGGLSDSYIERERRERLAKLEKKLVDIKFERIVARDKAILQRKAFFKTQSVNYDFVKAELLRTNLIFRKKYFKRKKTNVLLNSKKKKENIKPLWLKSKKKSLFTFKKQYLYQNRFGVNINLSKWELFRHYSLCLKRLSPRSFKFRRYKKRHDSKLYFGYKRRKKNFLLINIWLKKSGKIGRNRYLSFKKKMFKGPRFRYSSKKNNKIFSFIAAKTSLRVDRKWTKLNFLFWRFFRFFFCLKSKMKLKKIKNVSKNFHNFTSLMESRLFSIVSRSLSPSSSLSSVMIKAGLIKVNERTIKDCNYLLSPLDLIQIDLKKLYVLTGRRGFYLLSLYKKILANEYEFKWQLAVFGSLKKNFLRSLTHLVCSQTKFFAVFLKRPHFFDISKLPFQSNLSRFYSFAYNLV